MGNDWRKGPTQERNVWFSPGGAASAIVKASESQNQLHGGMAIFNHADMLLLRYMIGEALS